MKERRDHTGGERWVGVGCDVVIVRMHSPDIGKALNYQEYAPYSCTSGNALYSQKLAFGVKYTVAK